MAEGERERERERVRERVSDGANLTERHKTERQERASITDRELMVKQ